MKSLLRGLRSLGKEQLASIRFVCSDMWKAYLKVIRKKLPDALHILDRYHIVANLNKAIDKVRAAEARRLQAEGSPPCWPIGVERVCPIRCGVPCSSWFCAKRAGAVLRENVKNEAVRFVALLRKLLLEIGTKLHDAGVVNDRDDVFFLDRAELSRVILDCADLQQVRGPRSYVFSVSVMSRCPFPFSYPFPIRAAVRIGAWARAPAGARDNNAQRVAR